VLSCVGRGLRDGLITLPEESYRVYLTLDGWMDGWMDGMDGSHLGVDRLLTFVYLVLVNYFIYKKMELFHHLYFIVTQEKNVKIQAVYNVSIYQRHVLRYNNIRKYMIVVKELVLM
jgi:hypothetical protein